MKNQKAASLSVLKIQIGIFFCFLYIYVLHIQKEKVKKNVSRISIQKAMLAWGFLKRGNKKCKYSKNGWTFSKTKPKSKRLLEDTEVPFKL